MAKAPISKIKKPIKGSPFHEMLSKVMEALNKKTFPDHLTWNDDGTAFVIDFSVKETTQAMRGAFEFTSHNDFLSNLENWGFQQEKYGTSKHVLCHDLFRRNAPDLCNCIVCPKSIAKSEAAPVQKKNKRRLQLPIGKGSSTNHQKRPRQSQQVQSAPERPAKKVTKRRLQLPISKGSSTNHRKRPRISQQSQNAPESPAQKVTKRSANTRGVKALFPVRLHRILLQLEAEGNTGIAEFVPDGRAFRIHDQIKFIAAVAAWSRSWGSFRTSLTQYEFNHITTGPYKGEYSHELFVKDRPELCSQIRRKEKANGDAPPGRNKKGSTSSELSHVVTRASSRSLQPNATTPSSVLVSSDSCSSRLHIRPSLSSSVSRLLSSGPEAHGTANGDNCVDFSNDTDGDESEDGDGPEAQGSANGDNCPEAQGSANGDNFFDFSNDIDGDESETGDGPEGDGTSNGDNFFDFSNDIDGDESENGDGPEAQGSTKKSEVDQTSDLQEASTSPRNVANHTRDLIARCRIKKKRLFSYPFSLSISDLDEAMNGLTQLQNFVTEGAADVASKEGRSNNISIEVTSYDRTKPFKYFDDALIDFWAHWMRQGTSECPIHVFPSFLYTWFVESGYERVEKWTKNKGIDVFTKKFLYIPVNIGEHWSLCVIVNASALFNVARTASSSAPCIIFLDSLGCHIMETVTDNVRRWLDCERVRLNKGKKVITETNMPAYQPIIPRQNNGSDCGVFVCLYISAIYKLRDWKFSYTELNHDNARFITNSNAFQFDMSQLPGFRSEMRMLIERLTYLYWTRKREKSKAITLRETMAHEVPFEGSTVSVNVKGTTKLKCKPPAAAPVHAKDTTKSKCKPPAAASVGDKRSTKLAPFDSVDARDATLVRPGVTPSPVVTPETVSPLPEGSRQTPHLFRSTLSSSSTVLQPNADPKTISPSRRGVSFQNDPSVFDNEMAIQNPPMESIPTQECEDAFGTPIQTIEQAFRLWKSSGPSFRDNSVFNHVSSTSGCSSSQFDDAEDEEMPNVIPTMSVANHVSSTGGFCGSQFDDAEDEEVPTAITNLSVTNPGSSTFLQNEGLDSGSLRRCGAARLPSREQELDDQESVGMRLAIDSFSVSSDLDDKCVSYPEIFEELNGVIPLLLRLDEESCDLCAGKQPRETALPTIVPNVPTSDDDCSDDFPIPDDFETETDDTEDAKSDISYKVPVARGKSGETLAQVSGDEVKEPVAEPSAEPVVAEPVVAASVANCDGHKQNIAIRANDVIFVSDGRDFRTWIGNVKFRKLIDYIKPRYQELTRSTDRIDAMKQKREIINNIIQTVQGRGGQGRGGRFLRFLQPTCEYYFVDDKTIYSEVRLRLQDKSIQKDLNENDADNSSIMLPRVVKRRRF